MTDLKIVDFKIAKEKQEKIPDNVMESIEVIYNKAKEGKLKEVILYGSWDTESVDEEKKQEKPSGTLMLWNKFSNVKSLVAGVKILEKMSLDILLDMIFVDVEED